MKTPGIQWFKYASPQNFYFLAGKLWPWFAGLAAVQTLVGQWIALFPLSAGLWHAGVPGFQPK